MTLVVDRIEEHTVIEPLSRQVSRQIARRAAKGRPHNCGRCPDPVVDPANAVIDNGRVSHRMCAKGINDLIDRINHQAAAERLERAGVILATPNLIVPGE